MNPWIAKTVILAAGMVMFAIRAPHGARSRAVKVARRARSRREGPLLTLAWIGFLAPLIWAVSPAFSFADHSLRLWPLLAGVACLVVGLWFFHRSHVDLGTNWSVTLEIRENHRLVRHGVYRVVRHPMYAALFLYAIGQLLVVPNWLVGPSYFVSMVLLFPARVGAEERMMLEQFGDEYAAYMARTKRLVPGVWCL
jgi:protein-S-isoprenylcysteine O-methyltransferase Ste14